jgi:alpha-tubulin suppressor-like RCC1 family protein
MKAWKFSKVVFIVVASLAFFSLPAKTIPVEGQSYTSTQNVQTILNNLATLGAIKIVTGSQHTCAVTLLGSVSCWGYNQYGQVGDETIIDRFSPTNTKGLTAVGKVSAGEFHSCAIMNSGVKCWGDNEWGQLGNGTTTGMLVPVDVYSLSTGAKAVTTGANHSCAVTTSGGIKCWGDNEVGQLGDGTRTNRLTPVDVIGLTTGVLAVSAGSNYTCALVSNGGVKCWGINNNGELGDGTTTIRLTPTNVIGLTSGVTDFAAGYGATCAILNGGMKCWGTNLWGQLGDGTKTTQLIPVDVSNLTGGVMTIGVGYGAACAVMNGGALKCWGHNLYGQIGDGTTTDRLVPTDVYGLSSGVLEVSGGRYHTCALMNSGSVKCWGYNNHGQVGAGDYALQHYLTPVAAVGLGNYPIFNLPVTYSNFSLSAQGNIEGNGPGKVNSWFDHQYPTYSNPPNNSYSGLLRWDGKSFPTPTKIGEGWYDGHSGIDFQGNVGNQVFPAAAGIVFRVVTGCQVGNLTCGEGYGNQLWINHQNGYATQYGHLSSIPVSNGTLVGTQAIGTIGITGNSSGPHLHFGVYLDINSDGAWTENEVVDPYGWYGAGTDPWTPASQYLWKYPIWLQQSVGSSGAVLTSPSGKSTASIPAGALTTTSTVELWDAPVAKALTGLRSLGTSFWLRVLEWLSGILSPNKSLRLATTNSFAEPVAIQASFDPALTAHLNTNGLAILWWNEATATWIPLTTSMSGNTATGQTTQAGQFDLQALLLCSADNREPDDDFGAATVVAADGSVTSDLFDIQTDQDWFKFNAQPGTKYRIETLNLASGVDTTLELYGTDATTLLATDNNSGGGKASKLEWQAASGGTYFVLVKQAVGGSYGCGSTYQIKISVPMPATPTPTATSTATATAMATFTPRPPGTPLPKNFLPFIQK